MTTPPIEIEPALHQQLAKQFFNRTWELLVMTSRTPEQDDEMLHAAHASRYHWSFVGEPVNLSRGEWQLARVYAVLGRAEPALYHARRNLQIVEAHDLGGFDRPFAHEALARAAAVAGDSTAVEQHLRTAHSQAMDIEDEEDRAALLGDIMSVPGATRILAASA